MTNQDQPVYKITGKNTRQSIKAQNVKNLTISKSTELVLHQITNTYKDKLVPSY